MNEKNNLIIRTLMMMMMMTIDHFLCNFNCCPSCAIFLLLLSLDSRNGCFLRRRYYYPSFVILHLWVSVRESFAVLLYAFPSYQANMILSGNQGAFVYLIIFGLSYTERIHLNFKHITGRLSFFHTPPSPEWSLKIRQTV